MRLKLEEQMGVTGPCRCCGGEGLGRTALVLNGKELLPNRPGCPACGRDWVWKRIEMNFPEGAPEESLRVIRALARRPVAA